jgi:hypothetical protein
MIRTFCVSLLLFGAVGLSLRSRLEAECIVPPAPCEALKKADYVFLADAEQAGDASEAVGPGAGQRLPQVVRFHIIEAFKGVDTSEQRIEARNRTDGAEMTVFRAGNRYLVYAKRERNGVWSTECSRTALVRQTGDERIEDELRELRTCRTAGRDRPQ